MRPGSQDFGGTGGGTFSATCCGAGAVFAWPSAPSAASPPRPSGRGLASALPQASERLGGAALAAFEATLSGADAENRSLNMSCDIAATVSGFAITGVGSGSAAKTSLMICDSGTRRDPWA